MALSRTSHAALPAYTGDYWLVVLAWGGWDPTLFCDPKGGTINRTYSASAIKQTAGIRYAPASWSAGGREFYSNSRFFTSYGSRLTVINGIDMQTNAHQAGICAALSGSVSQGFPSLVALTAQAAAKTSFLPVPFISYSSEDQTLGIVPMIRGRSTHALRYLSRPNAIDPENPVVDYHLDTQRKSLLDGNRNMIDRLRTALRFGKGSDKLSSIRELRGAASGLDTLYDELNKHGNPLDLALPEYAGNYPYEPLSEFPDFAAQAQLCLSAFKANVTCSATITMGGFDTHGNHDSSHPSLVLKQLRTLDYIYRFADQLGIGKRLNVIAVSDFGRTPQYNGSGDSAGKDHWNVGSMMLSGPNIPGGRTVGASNDALESMKINRTTLAPDANGVSLRAAEVQRALRKIAKVTPEARYSLLGEDLPLFG